MGRRIPEWIHPQLAGRGGNKLAWRPGVNGGMRRVYSPPIGHYRNRITGVPLTGGQAQGKIPASGIITLSVTPQGLGTIWYPQAVIISTTSGALDSSTAQAYLGVIAQNTMLGGQSYFGGGDTIAFPGSGISPGQLIIVVWTGAKQNDVATMNVQGTMDALVM